MESEDDPLCYGSPLFLILILCQRLVNWVRFRCYRVEDTPLLFTQTLAYKITKD